MKNSFYVDAIMIVWVLFVFAGCFKSNPKMNDYFNFLTPKPGSYSSEDNAVFIEGAVFPSQ